MADYFTFPWQQLSKYAQQAQQDNSGGYYGYGGSLTKYLPSYQNQVSYSPNYNRNFQQGQQSYNTVPAPAAPKIQPLVQPATQQQNMLGPKYGKYANVQYPPMPVLPTGRQTYYPVSQEANVQPPPLPNLPGYPSQFIQNQQQQTYSPQSNYGVSGYPTPKAQFAARMGVSNNTATWSPEIIRKWEEYVAANPSDEQLFSKEIGIPRDVWVRNPELQRQFYAWSVKKHNL